MKTIVKGMNIERHYVVKDCKREDGTFFHRPYMEPDSKQCKKTFETILEYEGEPQFIRTGSFLEKFYISENEEVRATKKYFRADLGAWVLETDKILSEKNIGEKKCKQELAKLIKEYNKQKIESCDYLKAYCDIHKLSYEDTDYDELKEIVDIPKNYDRFKPDQATLNEILTKSTLNSIFVAPESTDVIPISSLRPNDIFGTNIFGDPIGCTCVNYEGIKDED